MKANNKNYPLERLSALKVKIFADGANLEEILKLSELEFVKGFTTNPTLMRKAGIKDYKQFAKKVLQKVPKCPISFEVISDDFEEMELQAREIASWGNELFVKIPITNTKGESSAPLIGRLSSAGVKLNVTAIMRCEQISEVLPMLNSNTEAVISVFGGRIADTGYNPIPVMKEASAMLKDSPHVELLWASPREILNILQAEECGCQIITLTTPLIEKLTLLGKDLSEFSLETVKMFYQDASWAGYKILSD